MTLALTLAATLAVPPPIGILETVLVAEVAEVQIGMIQLIDVEQIRAAIGGRHFLEQENLEAAAHQRVAPQVGPQCSRSSANSFWTLLRKMRSGFIPAGYVL